MPVVQRLRPSCVSCADHVTSWPVLVRSKPAGMLKAVPGCILVKRPMSGMMRRAWLARIAQILTASMSIVVI